MRYDVPITFELQMRPIAQPWLAAIRNMRRFPDSIDDAISNVGRCGSAPDIWRSRLTIEEHVFDSRFN
jgi:hypothetical protein